MLGPAEEARALMAAGRDGSLPLTPHDRGSGSPLRGQHS
jgi:hypothetical protein